MLKGFCFSFVFSCVIIIGWYYYNVKPIRFPSEFKKDTYYEFDRFESRNKFSFFSKEDSSMNVVINNELSFSVLLKDLKPILISKEGERNLVE